MAVFGFVVDRTLKRTCVDKLFLYARTHSSELIDFFYVVLYIKYVYGTVGDNFFHTRPYYKNTILFNPPILLQLTLD